MKTQPNDPINAHKHLNCNGQIDEQHTGLTKREYFAAMAAMGIASKPNWSHDDIAAQAVNIADALIDKLNSYGKRDL